MIVIYSIEMGVSEAQKGRLQSGLLTPKTHICCGGQMTSIGEKTGKSIWSSNGKITCLPTPKS